MTIKKFKYIYGPVHSWRLGMSLGIDPISKATKVCNLDCLYCQLGRTAQFYTRREEFVPVDALIKEIKTLPPMKIDYYTFSGRGEPTLAKNLGAMIKAVRRLTNGKIAVITNAVLMDQPDVQKDLSLADFVVVKFDACSQESLEAIDIPVEGIQFSTIVEGIKSFKRRFQGRLALQIMFIEENIRYASQIAHIAREIQPDEIEINTPLRPSGVKPLGRPEILKLKEFFEGMPVVTVYEAEQKEAQAIDEKETIRRHGNYKKNCKKAFPGK